MVMELIAELVTIFTGSNIEITLPLLFNTAISLHKIAINCRYFMPFRQLRSL